MHDSLAQTRLTVSFTRKAGKYDSPVQLQLNSRPSAKIYYTIDGTRPSKRSRQYDGTIYINKTTVVRAFAMDGGQSSRIQTQTYLIDEKTNFPVISLTIRPEILFDETKGWFNVGENADTVYPYAGANFWSRREVIGNIEFIESDGKEVFNSNVGIKLFGGMSRLFPQKSFAIACRVAYGESRIRHQIFPELKEDRFKHIVLRNAGSDWGKAHFRDAMITSLFDEVDISKQAYRPCLVFLNGKYWGIYNIREKVNRHYLEYQFGVDKDSVDLVEHRRSVKHGSIAHYDQLRDYMSKYDLAEPEHYSYIQSQMDVQNFMTYQIAQIYCDNQDGGGNIKFWRPQTPDGVWKWLLYDTDWGFGLQQVDAFKNNSLKFHTEPNGPSWPNPPWSTFILRQLLRNQEFKAQFINNFLDYLNTNLQPDNVIARIDSFQNFLSPEIDRHIERWSLNKKNWRKHIERMKQFAIQRPSYMRKFLQEEFDAGDLMSVQVDCSEGGRVRINNNITTGGDSFFGKYFSKVPIQLKAEPSRGYKFSHWEGTNSVETSPLLDVQLTSNANSFKAVFERSTTTLAGQVMFNEVSVNNKLVGDWVEIYNNTEQTINLKGWLFRDAKHDFIMPEVAIGAKDYLVLCQSSAAFKRIFPYEDKVIGDFSFGLNKVKESLELYSADGAPIDSFAFRISKRDSIFTFCLKMPLSDNSQIKNWDIITGNGSPGLPNPAYLAFQAAEQSRRIWNIILMILSVLAVLGLGYYFLGRRSRDVER